MLRLSYMCPVCLTEVDQVAGHYTYLHPDDLSCKVCGEAVSVLVQLDAPDKDVFAWAESRASQVREYVFQCYNQGVLHPMLGFIYDGAMKVEKALQDYRDLVG